MFRFTIRELILLTLVAAIGVGWWVDRSRVAAWGTRWKSSNDALIVRLDALNPNWRTLRRSHGPQLPEWQEP